MKKLLVIFLSLSMIFASAFARAGSSYSKSGSSRSSSSYSNSKSYSSSYSSPSRSYSSSSSYTAPKSYSYQTKSAASSNTYKPQPKPAPSTATYSKPTDSSRTTSTTTTTSPNGTTTINKTTVVNNRSYSNDRDYGNGGGFGGNGGGMGIGGTIAGVAGGIVVGSLLTEALLNDKHNAPFIPAGGYQMTPEGHPAAGQPVAPQMAGATEGNFVTDGKGGVMPAPTPATAITPTEPSMFQSANSAIGFPVAEDSPWYIDLLVFLAWVTGIALVIYALVKLFKFIKYRMNLRKENKAFEIQEKRLDMLADYFKQIQTAYSLNDKESLRKLCSHEQYRRFELTKHNNFEELGEGFTNIVDDIKIINIVTMSSSDEGQIEKHRVKINFSMLDYIVNSEGEVTHGSKEKPIVDSEIWEFLSQDNGSTWKLDRVL